MKSCASKKSFQLGRTWRNRPDSDWTYLYLKYRFFKCYFPPEYISKPDTHQIKKNCFNLKELLCLCSFQYREAKPQEGRASNTRKTKDTVSFTFGVYKGEMTMTAIPINLMSVIYSRQLK